MVIEAAEGEDVEERVPGLQEPGLPLRLLPGELAAVPRSRHPLLPLLLLKPLHQRLFDWD